MPFTDDTTRDLLLLITGAGLLQGLILAVVVLFYPQRDRNSNNWLALFILTTAVLLAAPGIQFVIPWEGLVLFHSIKYVAIASLYLYIRSLSAHIGWRQAWPHLIIAPLYLPLAYLHLGHLVGTYGLEAFRQGVNDPIDSAVKLFNLAYLVFYLVLDVRAWKAHKAKVERSMSQHHRTGIRWIGQLIAGYVAIIVVSFTLVGLMFTSDAHSLRYCLMNMVALTGFLYFVAIKGKLSPEIYRLRKVEEELEAPAPVPAALEAPPQQYVTTVAPPEDVPEVAAPVAEPAEATATDLKDGLADLALRAERLLVEEQLYTEESLTVKDLADRLEAPAYLVSQAINSALDRTFFELVNGHRVEKVKQLLVDPAFDHFSLVAIGFEAGFNSKTAFNTVFKRFTGLTPSQFRKANRPVLQES